MLGYKTKRAALERRISELQKEFDELSDLPQLAQLEEEVIREWQRKCTALETEFAALSSVKAADLNPFKPLIAHLELQLEDQQEADAWDARRDEEDLAAMQARDGQRSVFGLALKLRDEAVRANAIEKGSFEVPTEDDLREMLYEPDQGRLTALLGSLSAFWARHPRDGSGGA
jgi:hypothetical protein